MADGLDLKLQISSKITFCSFWIGNGPFAGISRQEDNEEDDENTDIKKDTPFIYLELKGKESEYRIRKFLKNKPIKVRVYCHSTGIATTADGKRVRGHIDIGSYKDDGERINYADAAVLMSQDEFYRIASMITLGGERLLSNSKFQLGFLEPKENLDFSPQEDDYYNKLFPLSDFAFSFEVGERNEIA